MRALFTSFPASDYETSTRFYEQAVCLKVLREFDGRPHRFKNYDLGGMALNVYDGLRNIVDTVIQVCLSRRMILMV